MLLSFLYKMVGRKEDCSAVNTNVIDRQLFFDANLESLRTIIFIGVRMQLVFLVIVISLSPKRLS